MGVSFHEALATLRYFERDSLRPALTEFVENIQSRLRSDPERDDTQSYDARAEAEAFLRELGAPWFALTSFVLPGWRWAGVPIHPQKKSLAHVNWILMRLDDFRREIERYQELFTDELDSVDPVPSLRRVLASELPKISQSLDESWEVYDSIQAFCTLLLEAWRLPQRKKITQTVKGFLGARKPSAEELDRFIEDVAAAVSREVQRHHGPPPYDSIDARLASIESELQHSEWLLHWLQNRLDTLSQLRDSERLRIQEDIETNCLRTESLREQIQTLFHDAVEALEQRVEILEEDWVNAHDRNSVITGERIDEEIDRLRAKLRAYYTRWEHFGTPDVANCSFENK